MAPKKAEPLTEAEEELLWKKGLLGDSTPLLLDTIIFMNELYFALRSGGKHRALKLVNSQIIVVQPESELPYFQNTLRTGHEA